MQTVAASPPASCSRVFGPAEVLELAESGEHVRVQLLDGWDSSASWARLAIGNPPLPQPGDHVLVSGETPDDLYVIGQLTRSFPQRNRVTLSCGVYAERIQNSTGEETIRVVSAGDELLFELDAATGTTRVGIPAGALELVTANGNLVLRSAATIRLEADAIELHGRTRIGLAITRTMAAASAWLRLLPDRVQLGSERAELSANTAEIQAATTSIRSQSLTAESEYCQIKAQKIETVAETFIERAGNVYRSVRDLVQVQAGRFRTYVSGLSHFRSQRAYFSAEEDFHVDGDKIHLG